jgi:CheY-like chemotaxis protein
MKALVVDDDALTRRALIRLLRDCGFDQILEADNGLHALATLADLHPDLIITDCQMPRMDGIALTRALRHNGQSAPIFMLSSLDDPRIIALALRAGVTQYICKPVQTPQLVQAIQRALAPVLPNPDRPSYVAA